MKAWFHGEVVIKVKKGKVSGDKVKPVNGQYKIADSETTGNFHLLEAKDSVEMYEKDGVLFCKSLEPTYVTCVDESRHDTIELPVLEEDEYFEIVPAKEYDHLTQEVQNVAD